MTRVVLFLSSMQFSCPKAINFLAPLAACVMLIFGLKNIPITISPLIIFAGFILHNGSHELAYGQAKFCL